MRLERARSFPSLAPRTPLLAGEIAQVNREPERRRLGRAPFLEEATFADMVELVAPVVQMSNGLKPGVEPDFPTAQLEDAADIVDFGQFGLTSRRRLIERGTP